MFNSPMDVDTHKIGLEAHGAKVTHSVTHLKLRSSANIDDKYYSNFLEL